MTPPADAPPDPYSPPTSPLLAEGSPSVSDHPVEPVPFWPRASARLADSAVHFASGFLGGILIAVAAGLQMADSGSDYNTALAQLQPGKLEGFLLAVLGATVYQVVCEAGHGSSLGKLLLGLVVLDESNTPCGFVAATKRNVAYLLDSLFFGAVGASSMSKSDKRQRIGDAWAETVVVRRRSAPQQSLRSLPRFLLVLGVAILGDALTMALPAFFRFFAA